MFFFNTKSVASTIFILSEFRVSGSDHPRDTSVRRYTVTMTNSSPKPSLTPRELLAAWGRVLAGRVPLLSIEITKDCPLQCPGCYAYGNTHLSGGLTLRDVSETRGDALVDGVVQLVRKHRPMHVSLVGGEPLIRHRELTRILPALSKLGVFTLVVTSAVLPIPPEWMTIPRVRVAVSVDGLPEHHDGRRKPATYERILQNIAGREVNIHWVITRPMLARPGYLQEYVSFWNDRPETNRIWVSLYTPQVGEKSAEVLAPSDRAAVAWQLPALAERYRKLLMTEGIAATFISPPKNPEQCLFAKMSVNLSADLKTRVEPCVFGGAPDCSQCGCAASSGLHWIRNAKLAGPLTLDPFIQGSMKVGLLLRRLSRRPQEPARWGASQ
jgi:MoaA/NifB/PqqE/SkfB family radical SAM enzyme